MLKIGLTTKTLTAICLTSLLTLSDVWINPAIADPDKDNREGLPGRRIGGGTRGEKCLNDSEQLVALVPQSNLILTKKAYPDLLFYIPPTLVSTKAEFSLQDENGNIVYQTNFKTNAAQKDDNAGEVKPHAGEIINLRYLRSLNAKPLPKLTPDQKYSWSLSIACGSSDSDSSSDISVFGSIQRVKSDQLVGQVEHKSPLEQAIADKKSGFWEDALTKVAVLKYSKPHDSRITNIWTQLLQAEKLDGVMGKDSLIKFKIAKDN